MRINFKLNGTEIQMDANPHERLSDVLRREFNILSVKESYPYGENGSSTIILDGKAVPACMVPIFLAANTEIITLEYFQTQNEYKEIINAFKQAGVSLCGYCNTGKILTIYTLLQQNAYPSEEEIKDALSGIVCRCTCMDDIISAVKRIKPQRKKR
ncbi:(2Fe-2S)-binding protein [Treponema phagedenis]|nr:2Fe-2S iron-sulfur cluster-binding protein [Treponema phagedenis]EFW36839.1 2Fe-2S iron-sulfur cluster-binding domain protein [Treponema phagedenis F0421]NVP24046.1 hypothetical protein [Treponema phagedenis]QKS93346.1 hypothetical protein HPJ96_12895 [Treponema phagedenis]QLC59575.1 hypothetical protein HW453_12745 [Treponema phagedenis]CEM63030.1 Nicotinate dehydrogenase small FeS subunit [Treponema phagedenis]